MGNRITLTCYYIYPVAFDSVDYIVRLILVNKLCYDVFREYVT